MPAARRLFDFNLDMETLLLHVVVPLLIVILLVWTIPVRWSYRDSNKLFESFQVVGVRKEFFAQIRATYRSLLKTRQWASEGYKTVRVQCLHPVMFPLAPLHGSNTCHTGRQ